MTLPAGILSTRLWKPAAMVLLNKVPVARNLDRNGHRIAFKVTRHNRIEPNNCEIQIFGLNSVGREAISTSFKIARDIVEAAAMTGKVGRVNDLELLVGYEGQVELLQRADIIDIKHRPTADGWVTTIWGKDGVFPFVNGIQFSTVAPGATTKLANEAIGAGMDIGLRGVDAEQALMAALPGFSVTKLNGGMVFQGQPLDISGEFFDSMKLDFYIEDGKQIIIRNDGVRDPKNVVFLGPPQLLAPIEFDHKGRGEARALLDPKMCPGRLVRVIDEYQKPVGSTLGYKCMNVEHVGDTHTESWHMTARLYPLELLKKVAL